jgi:hypothetical protein
MLAVFPLYCQVEKDLFTFIIIFVIIPVPYILDCFFPAVTRKAFKNEKINRIFPLFKDKNNRCVEDASG